MTEKVMRFVEAAGIPPVAKVLDVGGLNVNGSPRDRFTDFTAIDARPGPGVDVVASSHAMPFEDDSFDAVLCLEMLEHDPDPRATLAEIARVLRPGGRLVLTACGISHPKHDYPSDFWRFTDDGLRKLLHGFNGVAVTADADHVYATAAQWNPKPVRAPATQRPRMSVKFLANDSWACGWIRGILPAVALNKTGRVRVDVKPGVFYSDWQGTDVMVFQRNIDPASFSKMEQAQRQGIAAIYDCDDDFFSTPEEAPTIGFYRKPEVQHMVRAFLRTADVVTVSTPELAESFAREVPREYVVIENAVDPDPWAAAWAQRQARKAELMAGPPVVGWYASLAHVIDAPIIVPALCALMTLKPDLRLVLVGHASQFPASQALRQFAGRIDVLPWVDITQLGDVMSGWTVSAAPLTDHPYNRARSPLKWMEPALVGVPAVCSNLGPFARVVEPGTGVLAASPESGAWFQALEAVLSDRSKAWTMGEAARAAVLEKHTAALRAPEWEAAFRRAIEARRAAPAAAA